MHHAPRDGGSIASFDNSVFIVILYYCSCQGDTSVVVLIVLCFGVEFLYCLYIM